MKEFIVWVIDNKEWLFSGAGVAAVIGIGGLIFKKRNASPTQTIRSGNNSINIQANRDVNMGTKKKGSGGEDD